MQAERDTVLDVGLHTLEDLSGSLNSEDDGAETRGQEDDISSCLGGFWGALDRDTAIGFLQRRSVVDTWAS